ncbi:MAG: hypothetical protein IIX51_04040 [Methanocorpusculum sp.]|nr:hypothetical protein [Methanocorpusculum sp.]
MADTPPKPAEKPNIQAAVLPQIDEERAKELAREWIESNNLPPKKQSYRIGKAVMVYYPFWEFIREDGSKIKTSYRPACGTLMTDLQKMNRTKSLTEDIPENLTTLPISINASYYYPEIHGILLHPALFILDAAVVIFIVYQSRMFSLISEKKEGRNGS